MNPLPALKDAAYDRKLGHQAKEVYLLLVYELDLQAYREVKQVAIATLLDVDQATVSRALTQLLACGYIERLAVARDDQARGELLYRLVYKRLTSAAPAPSHQSAA